MPMASAPSPRRLQKDARQLLAVRQHIVGPFDGDARVRREVRRHVGGGDGGDEGQLRAIRPAAASGPQQQRGGEIALRRFPVPAAPAAARRSGAPAVIQSGPCSPASGQAARFFIGGIDFVEVA